MTMVLLRRLLGDELRRQRLHQQRTLREVSSAARVSLGYLSEVERGQKEASSELLSSICTALEVPLSVVLSGVTAELALTEPAPAAMGPADLAGSGLVGIGADRTAERDPSLDVGRAEADVVASAA